MKCNLTFDQLLNVHNLPALSRYPINKIIVELEDIHDTKITTRTAKFVRWLQLHVTTPASPTIVVHPSSIQS